MNRDYMVEHVRDMNRQEEYREYYVHIIDVTKQEVIWNEYQNKEKAHKSKLYIDKFGFVYFKRKGRYIYLKRRWENHYITYMRNGDKLHSMSDRVDYIYDKYAQVVKITDIR